MKDGVRFIILVLATFTVLFGGIYLTQRFGQPDMWQCWQDCESAGYRDGQWDGDQCLCFDKGARP